MGLSQFSREAAVVIVYVVLWNIGLVIFNTRNPIWRRCSHVNFVLVSNKKQQQQSVVGQPQTWFAWDLISPQDLVSGSIGVLGLTLFRAFEFCVFLFTIIYGNVLYGPAGADFFPYFTNWTFVLFGLTGLLGAVLTGREWLKRRRPTIPCIEESKPCKGTHSWSWWHRFYQLLLTTTCSASIMLTIFYWFADYLPGSLLRFDNPVKHGASSLLLLLDVALSRMPVVSYHVQVVIAYGSVYLVFLWSYYAATGTWVYRALDWSKFMSVPYYFALPLLLLLGFLIMFSVAALREVLRNNCSCRRNRRSDVDVVTAQPGNSKWAAVVPEDVCVTPEQAAMRSPRLAIALTPPSQQ